MGARLRLKTSVNGQDPALRTSDPNVRKIFRAMQKHGLIVADNGSDLYVTGTFDTRWNNDILNPAFALLTASDFDVIQLGWKPSAAGAAVASVSANPSVVVGGSGSNGSVALTTAAPASGALVSLSSASNAVQVPASVTVGPGATLAAFAITTSPVTVQTATTISASYGGATKTATLTITPAAAPQLAQLTLASASVVGGTTTSGTVTLSAPAGANGITVRLGSSKSTVAAVPSSVKVAAGARSATFAITTTHASRNRTATFTATYGSVKKSATLTVTR